MLKDEDILYKTIGVLFVQNLKYQKEQEELEKQITESKRIIEFAAKLSNFIEKVAECQLTNLTEIQSKAYDLMKEEESLCRRTQKDCVNSAISNQ